MLWWTLRKLKSNNPQLRIQALEELTDLKDANVELAVMKVASEDDNDNVRGAALMILGKTGERRVVRPLANVLIEATRRDKQELREKAGKALEIALLKIGDTNDLTNVIGYDIPNEDVSFWTELMFLVRKKISNQQATIDPSSSIVSEVEESLRKNKEFDATLEQRHSAKGQPQRDESKHRRLDPSIQQSKEAASKALSLLSDLCRRNDILLPEEILEQVKQHLRASGTKGSRALAGFIRELLNCRATKIGWALIAAQAAPSTPELLSALESVVSAEQLKAGAPRGFSPEIFGEGKVGWTDSTHERIKEQANQALKTLNKV